MFNSTHLPQVKSNLSSSASLRLTDSELLHQVNTILFVGSDSSSIALSWCLYLLAGNPAVQQRLRSEILSATASAEQIDSLPYLDNVIKETLRLVPPVHSTIRIAAHDDVIPTSEPVRMNDGTQRMGVQIRKGQCVHIAIEGFNYQKDVWGEDAWEFK
jgi:cytochrome P450